MSAAPLRVAYLVNQYPKISHSFVRREIQALERHGVEVHRIAIRGWQDELVDEDDRRERARTRYLLQDGPLPLIGALLGAAVRNPLRLASAIASAVRLSRKSDRPLWVHFIYLAEACRVAAWLRTDNIRHVHAHFGTNPAEVALLNHLLGGASYSFTVHGPEEFDKPMALHLGEKIRRASFVIAVSSFGSSQLRRWVELEHWSKIEVVRCGIESGFYEAAATTTATADRLVCVGRLCEQKGQLLLVAAAAELMKRGRTFELILAGDGELRPQIQSLIAKHGLERHIRITGWLSNSQVRDEILRSRAMVLPSFAEGLPVVIMEAMALRRPVLSTYVAGIPELVQPGRTGWLVPAGDVLLLADAMAAVLDASESELAAMGSAGYVEVLRNHSVDIEARKLSELFRCVMSAN